jgi:hypothetical protein
MWGALSDERSGLQFSVMLGISSTASLRSESHGTHEHILQLLCLRLGERGSVVVMLLCYNATNRKVAGSKPDGVNVRIYLILPVELGPGVYSASKRNEYQKRKNNNVSGE